MIKYVSLASLILLTAACTQIKQTDFMQDNKLCISGETSPDIKTSPDIIIDACTKNIQSGRFIGEKLAFIYHVRGIAYKDKGQIDRAIVDFDEAIRLKPNYTEVFSYRGLAYSQKGQNSQARKDTTEAIILSPYNSTAFFARGVVSFRNAQWYLAIEDFGYAIFNNPNDAVSFYFRARANEKINQRDEAIRDYKRAYEIGSRDETLISKLKAFGVIK